MSQLHAIDEKMLSLLDNRGVSQFAYSLSEKEVRELNYENGDFSLFRTVFDNTVSLRVIIDQKIGSASCNDFSDSALQTLVETAVSSAESAPQDPANAFAPFQEKETFRVGSAQPDMETLYRRFTELIDQIKSDFPEVVLMMSVAKHTSFRSIYRNSCKTVFEKQGGVYSVFLEYSATDGEKNTGFDGVGVELTNPDQQLISCGNIRNRLTDIVSQLNLIPSVGKFTGKIILTPECLFEFLQSLLSNYAGDGVILDGTGLWKDKVGQKVADERVSISLSVSHPSLVNPERITSDGYKSEETPLIEKGVLSRLVIGLYTANKTGNPVCKNSGDNLVMENGDIPLSEMIRSIDRGLIVGGFSGGEPGANGEFSGVAKNSFYVENGKIVGAVSETMINGNLGKLISSVFAVSKERVADGETVLPWLGVDGVVISGK